MSRNKAFNQVSFHPRASVIPHPDALREHFNPELSDSEVTAAYLMKRTIDGAGGMNPYGYDTKKHHAYADYLDNEAILIRENPTYRPARSASSLSAAAINEVRGIREDNEDNECYGCGKAIPNGEDYCSNC